MYQSASSYKLCVCNGTYIEVPLVKCSCIACIKLEFFFKWVKEMDNGHKTRILHAVDSSRVRGISRKHSRNLNCHPSLLRLSNEFKAIALEFVLCWKVRVIGKNLCACIRVYSVWTVNQVTLTALLNFVVSWWVYFFVFQLSVPKHSMFNEATFLKSRSCWHDRVLSLHIFFAHEIVVLLLIKKYSQFFHLFKSTTCVDANDMFVKMPL